jgi:hypothetical protein
MFTIMGMGTAPAADFDFNQQASEAIAQYAEDNPEAAAMIRGAIAGGQESGVGGAIGGVGYVVLGIGGRLIMAEPVIGSAILLAGALMVYVGGEWGDWMSSIDDEDRFPKVANTYINMAWDITESLGVASRSDKNREGWRIYLRLGELVAKTNPYVLEQGWEYAGPRDNDPDNVEEGGSFRTSRGSRDTLTGVESRWEASWYEETITLGWATGRAGRRLLVLYRCIATLARIKIILDTLPTVQERRAAFAGLLKQYVGNSTLTGVEFLGAPAPVSDFAKAILGASYDQAATLVEVVPAGTPPPPQPAASSGGGTLLAIAAAGIGTYLLVKG